MISPNRIFALAALLAVFTSACGDQSAGTVEEIDDEPATSAPETIDFELPMLGGESGGVAVSDRSAAPAHRSRRPAADGFS